MANRQHLRMYDYLCSSITTVMVLYKRSKVSVISVAKVERRNRGWLDTKKFIIIDV